MASKNPLGAGAMSGVMDWHAWLSSARLEPSLVHEYALVLARNELEAGDAAYFDHEFLRCMGISVAKHRLEILKLARPRCLRRSSSSSAAAASLSRILAAVDCAARYVRSIVRRRGDESSAALVLVPCQHQQQPDGVDFVRAGSSYGYDKAPKRTRSKPKAAAAPAPRTSGCRGAATVYAMRDVESGGEETVKWDRLFQDLNPN